jgi:hypothetical protein
MVYKCLPALRVTHSDTVHVAIELHGIHRVQDLTTAGDQQ